MRSNLDIGHLIVMANPFPLLAKAYQGTQGGVKFPYEKNYRKYSVDMSMRDFNLPGIKGGIG